VAPSTKNRGKKLLKKMFVAVVAAGALSVPFAGVAFADVGNNQGGTGGVPGAIGQLEGNAPHTLGSEVTKVAQLPGSVPAADFGLQPGQALKLTGITGKGH
jgi:hypothetical protein